MSEELLRLALSKKGQRQVTPFTGNELLYDYILDVLDDERKKAVETYLENSPEAQADFQKIQTGLQYAEKISAISVTPELQRKLSTPSSYFSVLFQKSRFDHWPVGLKWGLEALIVVFVIVTFLSLAPWERVLNLRFATSSNDVVLTEINKTASVTTSPEQEIPATKESPQFVDEGAAAPAGKSSVSPAVAVVAKPTEEKLIPAVKPTVTATPITAAAKLAETPNSAVAPTHSAETAAAAGVAANKANGGFLYRGKLAVTNLEAIGPKIRDKIMELGGRKAGEVELGWQKTPETAYYHFTIPEAKYEELQTFLEGYGTAKIDKEKHPRIMPDGIIRLIITADEAKK